MTAPTTNCALIELRWSFIICICIYIENFLPIFTVKALKREQRKSSRGIGRILKEQKARLYIIRRCVVMLLSHHD
ncbi:uncharacterized protein LOC112890479 [Panicum hallii]|uniref:uncharacterized protein LOC112890479 n=1 Tax=Panicum hallii TaxID=206008 RepID=UPI000DF4ECDF|nr:uncharacterized protein LOC112890479 [Panicum hallii]